ncbi:Maf-like protein YceF [Corynebacterium afermentans subsp. afermentans]|uniref:Nucleoside triphosphate pyrophosphatase n=2 Tax=Corynebacterium TaxID=1716 RepID=A0A9X8NAQ8_9CORY|nr:MULTISPECIES: nucleoside triphosphate pyrophosphatase [Corynebacterium]OAA16252.1 septum formation inhibitor Maf [Corynebacterium afermentans subsp. afermentans]WCZ33964.1 Maf-like protein YceF [Corynebacterium ihumii]WJY56116.1 Maf-like protein YceF [Corynebacterium afermentans subsp. afermentans]SIP96201.1 septum formation protein [Corynebacterium afermentans]
MRLVLASQSPSRRMLLEQGGVTPVLRPAHIDEDAVIASLHGVDAATTVSTLARAKAETAIAEFPDDVVVGCDSMLLLDGELLGKPHTVEATVERWKAQRGKVAQLLTGHAVWFGGEWVVDTVATTIRFGDVSDADIQAYAESGQPLECAGAFTLEALGSWFIDSIDGDPTSVIGLSMPLLRRCLYRFGLNASDFWA